jgi:hypothetical protein
MSDITILKCIDCQAEKPQDDGYDCTECMKFVCDKCVHIAGDDMLCRECRDIQDDENDEDEGL